MILLPFAIALAAQAPAPATALAQPPAQPPAAAAPAWRPLADDNWGHYFLDPASVVRDGALVRFRMRGVAIRALADGVMAIVTSQQLDCAHATMTTTGGTLYDADGRVTASREVPAAQQAPEPIAAGSAQDMARRSLCAAAAGN